MQLISEILAFIFGRKYYANIVLTRGTSNRELCSFIFHSRAEAEAHQNQLLSNLSFQFVETITFRSRHEY